MGAFLSSISDSLFSDDKRTEKLRVEWEEANGKSQGRQITKYKDYDLRRKQQTIGGKRTRKKRPTKQKSLRQKR